MHIRVKHCAGTRPLRAWLEGPARGLSTQVLPAIVLILCAASAGCGRPVGPPVPASPGPSLDPASFSGRNAYTQLVDFVAVRPREAGTPGAARAAEHLLERLKQAGVQNARIDEFRAQAPGGETTFRNVEAHFAGTSSSHELVIVAAHYDTKSGIGTAFEGANDSGSGVGILLELAAVLQRGPALRPDVILAFLDGEECRRSYGPQDGLHGSRHLAARLAESGDAGRVLGVIVLDMVGDRDLGIELPANSSPKLCSLVFEAARAEGARGRFSLAEGGVLDDHVPFLERGITAVDLIDFHYGSAPGLNDYWHTEQDSTDKIGVESLALAGRIAVRMLNSLSASATQ